MADKPQPSFPPTWTFSKYQDSEKSLFAFPVITTITYGGTPDSRVPFEDVMLNNNEVTRLSRPIFEKLMNGIVYICMPKPGITNDPPYFSWILQGVEKHVDSDNHLTYTGLIHNLENNTIYSVSIEYGVDDTDEHYIMLDAV